MSGFHRCDSLSPSSALVARICGRTRIVLKDTCGQLIVQEQFISPRKPQFPESGASPRTPVPAKLMNSEAPRSSTPGTPFSFSSVLSDSSPISSIPQTWHSPQVSRLGSSKFNAQSVPTPDKLHDAADELMSAAASASPQPTPAQPAPVAGLLEPLKVLRQAVLYPLLYPSRFRAASLKPPRGILLRGPAGVGKTLLARQLTHEIRNHGHDALLLVINGPEIVSSVPGRSEQNLRRVFEVANQYVATGRGPSDALTAKPTRPGSCGTNAIRRIGSAQRVALVFLDEVESLCPHRGGELGRGAVTAMVDDASQTQARIVAQLLTLLDGLNSSPQSSETRLGYRDVEGFVVVLAATNRPNALDPALRRPGRLDREIDILPPDAEQRLAILDLYARNAPLTSEALAFLPTLAAKTVGYVGADLVALIREAVIQGHKQPCEQRTEDNGESTSSIGVSQLLSAMESVGASALRDLAAEVPNTPWNSIAGNTAVRAKLHRAVVDPLRYPERYARMGLAAPRGVLLYGPPGCSKTTLARALATETGSAFFVLSGADIFSSYVGEAERLLRAAFSHARAASPSIIFLDEIDTLLCDRAELGSGGSGSAAHNSNAGVLATLLNEMDGMGSSTGVLLLGATNRPQAIDAALLRPGRFDLRLYIGPPDQAARKQVCGSTCNLVTI